MGKDMGYKLLGFVVWKGGKLYLRERAPGLARKATIGGAATLATVAIGGGVLVARRQKDSD
jgi:hypothetical protein